MKLISCNNCAVILDADKLKFAQDIDDEWGCIDDSKAKYNQNNKRFEPFLPCPLCKSDLFKEW